MKTRTQISINPDLVKVAQEIMEKRKFDSFSGLLEALIREEWERKSEANTLAESMGKAAAAPAGVRVVTKYPPVSRK